MSPAKRPPASPAGQGPSRAASAPEAPAAEDPPPAPPPPKRPRVRAPDVPTPPPRRSRGRTPDGPTPAAPVPDELGTPPARPAATKESTQLLGPDGEPVARDAGRSEPASPAEAKRPAPEDRPTTQSPGRSPALYAQRVWPD